VRLFRSFVEERQVESPKVRGNAHLQMALSNSVISSKEREKSGSEQKIEIWLPFVGDYRTFLMKTVDFQTFEAI
jgi:hypothetical protein